MDVDGALEALPIIADEMRARNMRINAEAIDVVAAEVRQLREEVEQQRIQIEADDENLQIWKDLIRGICNDAGSWESALVLRDRILKELV